MYRFHPPKFGDIIVFRAPARADAGDIAAGRTAVENTLVKRIIGLPGDTITVAPEPSPGRSDADRRYCIIRNGKPLVEPYIKEPMEAPQPEAVYAANKPIKLGPDDYFVLGDNRNDSNDSRYWGPLERKRISGKVTAIVGPPGRERQFP